MFNLFKVKNIDELEILSNNYTSTQEDNSFREDIVNRYKDKNYSVWNHTNDKGLYDKNINIIIKKNRTITLIHCQFSTRNISLEDIKEFEIQRDNFIIENPVFKNYTITLLYSLTGFFLTEDAFWYMQKHTKLISYEVIK